MAEVKSTTALEAFKASRLSRCELVTADTPRAEVDRIASAWREGLVHLLITTTCGLVGNENKLARFIFFHHCLYAITNLIQGIGRLRLIQRGPDSVVTHIESDDFIEEEAAASRASQLSKDCDTLIDQLFRQVKGYSHFEAAQSGLMRMAADFLFVAAGLVFSRRPGGR